MFNIITIREMQIKFKMRYYFTPTRAARNFLKGKITNIGEDVEKLELLYTAGGACKCNQYKMAQPLWKILWQKIRHTVTI